MIIQDMHIAIDLELNKVNSNLYDIVLPEEKDYFLNRAQERFIKQRYGAKSNNKGEGFEMSQKRIDDLQNLLVPNYYDKAYRLPQSDFDYESKVRFFLPNDYMFLTSQRSKVMLNECGNIVPKENVKNEKYYILDINLLNNVTNGYSTFKIKRNSDNLIYIENLNYQIEDRSLFVTDLINTWNSLTNNPGYDIYYERYRDIVSSGNLIFVAKDNNFPISWQYGEITVPMDLIIKPYTYFTATCAEEKIVTNVFAQQDDIYKMQMDPFNNTNMWGPLTIINNQFIDVFINLNNFVVKEVSISYIRKPKLISLKLNQSCELAEETHAEIIRDAVNLMLENFEASNRLQTSLQVEQTNE
jgi:hypothetical protein